VASTGADAEAARTAFRATLERKGHAVDNAREAIDLLERAFEAGTLQRTEDIEDALFDLRLALATSEGAKLGGKSAEAARLIGRRLSRLIDEA
jgi:predicted RNA-binding Zn ribbon-like protein